MIPHRTAKQIQDFQCLKEMCMNFILLTLLDFVAFEHHINFNAEHIVYIPNVYITRMYYIIS